MRKNRNNKGTSARDIFLEAKGIIYVVKEYAKSSGQKIEYSPMGRKLDNWYRLLINDAESLDVCCGSNTIIRGANDLEIALQQQNIGKSEEEIYEWSASIMDGDNILFEWRVCDYGNGITTIYYPNHNPDPDEQILATDSIDFNTIRELIENQKVSLGHDEKIDELLALYDSITTFVRGKVIEGAKALLETESRRMKGIKKYAIKYGALTPSEDSGIPNFPGQVYTITMDDGEVLQVYINDKSISVDIKGYDPYITISYDEEKKPYLWMALTTEYPLGWTVEMKDSDPISFPDSLGIDRYLQRTEAKNMRELIASYNPDWFTDGVEKVLETYDAITEILERDGQTKPVEEFAGEVAVPLGDIDGVKLPKTEQEGPSIS